MRLEGMYSKKPEHMTDYEYFSKYGPEGIPEGRFKEGREFYNTSYTPYKKKYSETDLKKLISFTEDGTQKEYVDFIYGNKNRILNIALSLPDGINQDILDQLAVPDTFIKNDLERLTKIDAQFNSAITKLEATYMTCQLAIEKINELFGKGKGDAELEKSMQFLQTKQQKLYKHLIDFNYYQNQNNIVQAYLNKQESFHTAFIKQNNNTAIYQEQLIEYQNELTKQEFQTENTKSL